MEVIAESGTATKAASATPGHGVLFTQWDGAEKSIAEWVSEINRLWARGPAYTIELGRTVAAAKRLLPRGAWSQLWKKPNGTPFRKRKGEMFVVIGKGLGHINAQTSAQLPGGWTILYQLALLDRPTLDKLINDGTIHPKLSLGEAEVLVAMFRGQPVEGKAKKVNVKIRLRKFREFVDSTLPDWSMNERQWAEQELLEIIDQIGTDELSPDLEKALGQWRPSPRRCVTLGLPLLELRKQQRLSKTRAANPGTIT